MRAALAAVQQQEGQLTAGGQVGDPARQLSFGLVRLRNTAADLVQLLRDTGRTNTADELSGLMRDYDDPRNVGAVEPNDKAPQQRLAVWVERLVKLNSTEQRSLHEEMAQLLTYSVNASETEQETQKIAITSLKLGQRAADAFASRDAGAADQILADSQTLAATVASLPISPLIQSDMVDAIGRWREGLATTAEGLRTQAEIISEMDAVAERMISNAAALNELFTSDADRIGQTVRTILLLGAAIGLLLGTGTAFVVARSITEPLRRLQEKMIRTRGGPECGADRRSLATGRTRLHGERGELLRSEIGHREEALRHAEEPSGRNPRGAAGDADPTSSRPKSSHRSGNSSPASRTRSTRRSASH